MSRAASFVAVGVNPDATANLTPSAKQRGLRTVAVALVWLLFALPFLLVPVRCLFAVAFHAPCPGCGMTRAVYLMRDGDIGASLRMHPLAFPEIGVAAFFVAVTLWLTWREGSPFQLWGARLGRWALLAVAATHVASALLWAFRWIGLFGGPVPV